MKTVILAISILFSVACFGQKKDSIQMVQITLSVEDYKEFVKLIESNIDSKKETLKIYSVLDKGFKTFFQPADKPKEIKKP